MKIDRHNPRHWYYLAKSGSYSVLSLPLRAFRKRGGKKTVLLYGHKYNGNLKAFAEYCTAQNDYKLQFAIMDPDYYAEMKQATVPVEVLSLLRFKDVLKISRCDAVVSDRRAHLLYYFLRLTRIPFFDVWHGVQIFKRFAPKDMAMLKHYTEIWVPSPAFKKVYVDDYLLPAEKVKVTGYGRVDAIVNRQYKQSEMRKKYGISDRFDKIVLLAPTWQQNDPNRQVIPFNEDPQHFLQSLNAVAARHNSLVIFRAHLNTNAQNRTNLQSMDHVLMMSHNDYPLSEEFVAMADVFIGDWSSIAFDFLPLHRPAIFMDAPVPFRHGLTFGKEHRYGEVVCSLEELAKVMERYLLQPEEYMRNHGEQVARTEELAYGDTLDGQSCKRYYERLQARIGL